MACGKRKKASGGSTKKELRQGGGIGVKAGKKGKELIKKSGKPKKS